MAVTPTGRISLPLYNLQTLIANSDDFRTWTSTADVAAARGRIYMAGVRSPTRPFCLINDGDFWETTAMAGGASHEFIDMGSLKLLFEAAITASYYAIDSDALFEFTNSVGAIIGDMLTLAGQSGYLAVQKITKVFGPHRESLEEKSGSGYFYQLGYEVFWGP